MEIIFEEN